MAGRLWSVGLASIVCAGSSAAGQVSFVDASGAAGFLAFHMAGGMTSGIAAEDFDGDGDVDLFVPNGRTYPDQFYENLGGGVFVENAATMGLASTENHRGALWVDYDGDHDLDLLVAGDNHLLSSGFTMSSMRLWQQQADGSFVERTTEAGLGGLLYPAAFGNTHLGGMAAGDLDEDGWVDIILTFWQTLNGGALAHVFMNHGDGTFTDATATSGLGAVAEAHWQPVIHDFNRDGWLDVFVAVDYTENRLWLNQHDGTFVGGAGPAKCDNAWNDMGVALGDYDNDGDFDLIVTNIYDDPTGSSGWVGTHNVLFRNDSAGGVVSFAEVSEAAGVHAGDWGWGVTFFDADCDGWLDVAQTNGFATQPRYVDDMTHLFRSLGGSPVTFADLSPACGVSDIDVASCMIAADVDRDGDLDLLQTCAEGTLRLYENQTLPQAGSVEAGYLVVRPRMHGHNWWALGAEVRVRTGSVWRARLITAGTSMMGQEPSEAHFGLGGATVADEVVVSWPDGRETVLTGVGVNQVVDVVLRCRGDVEGDGDTDVFDFGLFAASFAAHGLEPFTGGDLDGDGDVDVFDFPVLAVDFGCQ